jgi:RNA polymerase sigma-70 factor (ECF subfamily)
VSAPDERADERDLIARALRGEADAWDALFDLHYAPTARFLWQIAPGLSHEDVEELAQETFLKVVQRLGQFGGGSRLQTWIFRIAANTARDFRDKQRAAKRGGGVEPLPLDPAPDDDSPPLDPPSPAPTPDAALSREERFLELRRTLDELGDPCREIIELRYFADRSYEQIAADLGLNVKTVSSRLSKCLDRLGEAVHATRARELSPDLPSNPS